jgi:PAS domain S-box-containing protein
LQTFLIAGLLAARARRRRAEKDLRQSEERFSGVFRGSPVAISIIRQSDGRLVDVNPEWERFYGIGREDAVEHSPLDLGLIVEPETDLQFREFLTSGRSLRNFEQKVRSRGGRMFWRSLSCELVPLGGGPCYVVMSKDISEQREMEEARQSLARATRLATLGELTASIAHEVNQPLGAILSNADAAEMLLERGDADLAEVRQILADIRRDDLRASEVIQRVRALVGKHEVSMSRLDVNTVLGDSLRLVAPDAQRRGVTIVREFAPDLPPVHGDPVQIEQLLLNLLVNAMDAMKDTSLARRGLTLRSARAGDNRVEVTVEDSGPGIEAEKLPKVFDSFFTTKEGGMGLGLALARSIAEAHGGSITAANHPEGGAVFRLVFPANGHPSHDPTAPTNRPPGG